MSIAVSGTAAVVCPGCGGPLTWVAQYAQWWCPKEQRYYPPAPTPATTAPAQAVATATSPVPSLWTMNFYRIRKKVLALTNQYWIEDQTGNQLGYTRQKMLRLKEDIRIFADESMTRELFQIRQQQILDIWGTFAVVDSGSNALLGYIRRRALPRRSSRTSGRFGTQLTTSSARLRSPRVAASLGSGSRAEL